MAKRRRKGSRRGRRRGTQVIRFKRVGGATYRRNPAFSVRGMVSTLQTAVPRAAAVVTGKAATRIVANFLPLPKEGMMNTVTQIVAALIVGTVAKMAVPARFADDMVVGGIVAPIESLAKALPVIGPALGDDDLVLGEYYTGGAGEIGAYNAGEIGQYEDELAEYEIV